MNIYQPLFKQKDIINRLCEIYCLEKKLRYSSNLVVKDDKTSYLIVGDNYFIIFIYLFEESKWRLIIRNELKVFFDIKTKSDYTINIDYQVNSLNFYIRNNVTKREDNLVSYIKGDNVIVSRYFNFIDRVKKIYIISEINN